MKLVLAGRRAPVLVNAVLLIAACSLGCAVGDQGAEDQASSGDPDQVDGEPLKPDLYSFAGGCFAIRDSQGSWLARDPTGSGFGFVEGDQTEGTPFYMKAADLATYLLYDSQRGYVVGNGGKLIRQTSLHSDATEMEDRYISEAEWVFEAAGAPADKLYRLRHHKTGGFLSAQGVSEDMSAAAIVSLVEATDCTAFPEMSLDATVLPRTFDLSTDAQGTVQGRTFPDGSLWGLAEVHTHMMANFGFGGGGIVHGAPFHRLGVEHALGDCSAVHGFGGVKDVMGAVFDEKLNPDYVFQTMLPKILSGNVTGVLHSTKGYPDFTDWPSKSESTHQVQYYKWLERAWMGGLRLIVQHAVSNSVLCELSQGLHLQNPRYGCNDMVSIDRQIEETYALEQYVDAQAGGPGKGFFRIVTSPAQSREVIRQGKLAVVLGIETSNLFDCFVSPRAGAPTCNEAHVLRMLDEYHARGIRALFPVHKYDNAFSAGDGQRGFIEVGNFLNSGHYSNFTLDGCPDWRQGFDQGDVNFKGLNKPRNDYMAPPPFNMSHLSENAALTLLPHVPRLLSGSLAGNYCQKHGMTRIGDFLVREMMKRGMVVEIDHLPRHARERGFELLRAYDYPPAATHGQTGPNNQVYALGGISKANVGGCRDANRKGATLDALRSHIAAKIQAGAYPGEAMSWDLNGFAGAPGPRFGAKSNCQNQSDRVTYPFPSYGGDVTFTQPRVGNRVIDYNEEGLVHIGLLPEFIEDLRGDAESDAELEPMFRSAEAYLRMWEKAEIRGEQINLIGFDDCPADPNKTELGVCGCGVPDTDTDGDGTPDCNDRCKSDPNKVAIGFCGCGSPDADTDRDGVLDCIDQCAFDPDKARPGACGCGTPETDSDGDTVPDCRDRCPDDPDKLDTGVCGCAAADVDTDGDGEKDCVDECSFDPNKSTIGICGCGVADTDSDGDHLADCEDNCPSDPNKATLGICGCGVADTDSDGDGRADCEDNCPSDPGKTSPGACGCGRADTDSDGDGTVDCYDQCPHDPNKTFPGYCSCGTPEGRCGLLGSYYQAGFFDNNYLGNFVFQRQDATIDFDWGNGKPRGDMNDHKFGVRWTGLVHAPTTDNYTFYTIADDGVRLWVNGQMVIDDWSDHSVRERSGTIHLEAGRRYPIRVEYYERYDQAVCKLLWSSGGVSKQIVPERHLAMP